TSIASHGDSVSQPVISRQVLGQHESIFDILRMLVAAFGNALRQLARDIEKLLGMNFSGAAGAFSSLGVIALGLTLWTTIASIVWGFLLSSPAVILPIAISLAPGNDTAREPDPGSESSEAVRLVPAPRLVAGHAPVATMTPTTAPSTSPQPLSTPASNATASGSPPSTPTTTIYAYGMRSDHPERDPGSRPRTNDEVEVAAQTPRHAISATPATATPLRERRARRLSKKARFEPPVRYEKISAEASGQTPNNDCARIHSAHAARATKPPPAGYDRITPRGRCDAPTEERTGATVQPLLPTTWVDSLERDDS
ncbi:MAG TPA: hypothetical protein VGC05_12170, partial [Mycobacterium sp.]